VIAVTRNPWAAVDVGADPTAHARILKRAHERGIADGSVSGVRELVAARERS
jgi:hypothetical protein